MSLKEAVLWDEANFLTDLVEAGLTGTSLKAVLVTSLAIACGGLPPEEIDSIRSVNCTMISRLVGPELGGRYQSFIDWILSSRVRVGRVSIPAPTRAAVIERDGDACVYCGDKEGPFHLDHIWPVWRGGETSIDNLVVACRRCNLWKAGATIHEWKGTQ